jgi:predicted RND superfamily exporter protein
MQVVMIVRLYAMYQQSRKMLIFLVVIFMAITITFGVMGAIGGSHASARKL